MRGCYECRLPHDVALAVAQEQHLETVNVTLCLDPPNVTLKVKDDGCGIATAEIREGFGFVNMRARVNKLNGVLTVRTAPGRGTSIVACVPVSGLVVQHPGLSDGG